MSGWTGRQDSIACCGDSPGAIAPDEEVVALVTRGAEDKPTNFPSSFSKSRLLEPKTFSNVCGESDGTSVDRRSDLDADALAARVREFAGRDAAKPRIAEGYASASAGDLRQIRSDGGQKVFVYDDPGLAAGSQHAVIRVAKVDGPDFLDIRERIIAAFKRRGVSIRKERNWVLE